MGNHESTALRWVSFDELCELSDEPGLRRLATAWALVARRDDGSGAPT